ERRGAALEKQKQTEIIRRYFSETKPRLSQFRMCPTKRGLSRSSMFRFSREFALNEGKGLLLESTLLGRQNEVYLPPSRLPVASRPNPKPISDKHLRELSIAAKKLFPLETSFSFRAWLH